MPDLTRSSSASEQYRILSLGALTSAPLGMPDVLLEPWLREGEIWMVHAAAGVGKTFFALNVAWALASGGRFLGWNAARPRQVLYLDGEMADWDFQERMNGIVAASRRDQVGDARAGLENFHLFAATSQPIGVPFPDLATQDGLAVLMERARGHDLVVIDSLATTMRSGDEDESVYWSNLQDSLVELRKRRTAVLIVHHVDRSGPHQAPATMKEVILDGRLSLTRPVDYSPAQGARWVLSWEKMRNLKGIEIGPLTAAMHQDDQGRPYWETEALDDEPLIRLRTLLMSGDHANVQELAAALGEPAETVVAWKTRAIQRGLFSSAQWANWQIAAREARVEGGDRPPLSAVPLR